MRPGTGREAAMISSQAPPLDSMSIIDLLDKRMNELEHSLTSTTMQNNISTVAEQKYLSRPNFPVDTSSRRDTVTIDCDETVYKFHGLQTLINSHAKDIDRLLFQMDEIRSANLSSAEGRDEFKDLRKKLKSVTKEMESDRQNRDAIMGRHQEALDNITRWADHIHSCFGVVSQKLGFANNLCSKIRIRSIP
jgi:uncharacterized coiled-coil protein SlyX